MNFWTRIALNPTFKTIAVIAAGAAAGAADQAIGQVASLPQVQSSPATAAVVTLVAYAIHNWLSSVRTQTIAPAAVATNNAAQTKP